MTATQRKLRLEAEEIQNGYVARVIEQTHRENDFSSGGPVFTHAGLELKSDAHPAFYRTNEAMFFVRGRARDRDNGRVYVPRWNDAPERTREEVLAAFDRAIALAEQGEQ